MLAAGRALGVEIMIVECRSDRDYEAGVAKMAEGGADGMILGSFVLPNLGKVVPLSALHKLPTIYTNGQLVRAGGLMSYATDSIPLARRLGSAYVARILKGAKPADIPVEQPTKFELVINLKTANDLGLTVARHALSAVEAPRCSPAPPTRR
jgi:putative ABC transport system substrate-binding protein